MQCLVSPYKMFMVVFHSLYRLSLFIQASTFTDINFRLSYTEDILLQWDQLDEGLKEAATLGASLSLGKSLHRDVQDQYLKPT